MVKIAIFKGGFASGFILQFAVGPEPRDTVNHRYHVARHVGRIRDTSVPQSHVSNQNAPFLRISTDRWRDFTACFFLFWLYPGPTDLQM